MIKGLEHVTCNERLRAGFVQPSEEKVPGDIISVCNYLTRGYRENGARVFLEVHSDRMGGNGHLLEHGKF